MSGPVGGAPDPAALGRSFRRAGVSDDPSPAVRAALAALEAPGVARPRAGTRSGRGAPVPRDGGASGPALNQTETAYARHLDRLVADGRLLAYRVQPVRLDIGRDGSGRPVTYRPDFAVWPAPGLLELHEVKAARRDATAQSRRRYRAEEDALVKLAAVGALYPQQPLCVVWPDGAAVDGWAREWRVPSPHPWPEAAA